MVHYGCKITEYLNLTGRSSKHVVTTLHLEMADMCGFDLSSICERFNSDFGAEIGTQSDQFYQF